MIKSILSLRVILPTQCFVVALWELRISLNETVVSWRASLHRPQGMLARPDGQRGGGGEVRGLGQGVVRGRWPQIFKPFLYILPTVTGQITTLSFHITLLHKFFCDSGVCFTILRCVYLVTDLNSAIWRKFCILNHLNFAFLSNTWFRICQPVLDFSQPTLWKVQ